MLLAMSILTVLNTYNSRTHYILRSFSFLNSREQLVFVFRELLEARWPIGRALDPGARGRGFDPHSGRRVVSLSKIHLPPKSKKYW